MIQLLLFIISYGSLLLLLMNATIPSVIATAILLVLGAGLIVYKKLHKYAFRQRHIYFLIPITVLLVVCFGQAFYRRWLSSSKMEFIASMLHMPIETLLLIGSVTLSLFCAYSVYTGLRASVQKLSLINQKNNLAGVLLCCLLAAGITVLLNQFMIELKLFSMGFFHFLWGALIVWVVILFLYCLFGRCLPSILIGSGIFMVISTINVYVFRFRGRLFEPVDLFSATTAMNVAENYSLFPIPFRLLAGWGLFASMMVIFYYLLRKNKPGIALKKRLVFLAVCVISSAAIFFYSFNLKTHHWHKDGAYYNGYVLDFVSKFKEISPPKPGHYSAELIAKLEGQYAQGKENQEGEPAKRPHIIVIMNEAFSDLRALGEFSTNTEVMPFISSLKENTISGYALASVYGGNTANSEYEFLTGNSLAWLSPNVVPYQQYLRSSTYSMVSHLKETYNYKCLAMHPFHSSGWNRPAAYRHLGFDSCYFLEDFPQKNLIRNYVSDQEMFEFLIQIYEAQKENPLFLFGVTMQNHGGYTYKGENFTNSILLKDHAGEFPEVEQYLSLIHETDKAVEYLISYFQQVDEDTIIVFYGDHQPKTSEAFHEAINGTTESTLDEQQNLYKIPFFIWANYDIEEEQIDCTSLNYLSSYLYRAAGIPLPPYVRFLQELETAIPSINANGFYSLKKGCYLPFDEAENEELQWLEFYEALQYNSMIDKTKQSKIFFPMSE